MQNHANTRNILDTDRIRPLLFKLTAPMFLGMLIQNIYFIVDAIFIGNYVGEQGLATLSIFMPVQLLVMGIGNMVSVGGASLISRLIGRQEHGRAERALGNSIFFAVLFSIVLSLVVIPFASFWLNVIGTSESVMPFARDYLVIVMSGTVFNITGLVLMSMARAEGNARVSMVSLIIQSVLCVTLDAIFMIALKMGISGAALAMVISQGIALIYVLSYYFIGGSYLKIRWRNTLPDMTVVRDIFAIGVSQLLKAMVDCFSALVLVKMVSRYGGDVGLSAFSIGQRIMMFASMPSLVLGQAMQPILGFNYGAERFRLALKSISLAVTYAAVLGIAALIIVTSLAGPIINIFTSEAELVSATSFAFKLMFLGLPLFAVFNVGQLVFPSIGKALPSLLISVIRPLFFIAPVTYVLSYFLQITGTWLTFPVSDTLAFLLILTFLIPLIKKFRKEIKDRDTTKAGITSAEPQLDTEPRIL